MIVLEGRLGEIVASHQAIAAIDDSQLGMIGPAGGVEYNRDPAFFQGFGGLPVCPVELLIMAGVFQDNPHFHSPLPCRNQISDKPCRPVTVGSGCFKKKHGKINALASV